MNDLFQSLKAEFQNEDYRYAYAESFLNTKLATQIKTLREQREKTQAEIAARMGIKQPGYQRFEDVNHLVWKTDSLWSIARALGVRLDICFETFGTLPEEKKRFNKENLRRPKFEDDPAFRDEANTSKAVAAVSRAANAAGLIEGQAPPSAINCDMSNQAAPWPTEANRTHGGEKRFRFRKPKVSDATRQKRTRTHDSAGRTTTSTDRRAA